VAWTYLQLYLLGKRLTERRELSTLRSLVAPGMVIADIGANVGFYTLEMASSVGPTGRILAFEPEPFSFSLLQTRARLAPSANVEAHQLALGDTGGHAILYCSAYNRADNRLSQSHREPSVEAVEVPIRCLDDFLLVRGTPAIDAIKVDVQGSEERVFRGAQQTLERGLRWIWVEFSPLHLRGAGSDPRRFLCGLGNLGMEMFEVAETGQLRPITDVEELTARIGAGYSDLVLIARPSRERPKADP
jgi:FkbM family methyltransferase